MAAPSISSVVATATTVTATVVKGTPTHVRARLVDYAGTEEDEQSRSGSGDVALTIATAVWPKIVFAWGVDSGDNAGTEPSNIEIVERAGGGTHVIRYSLDGGKTWNTLKRQDAWPAATGATIVRATIPQNQKSKSIMVEVAGANQLREGVRRIILFGEPYEQLGPKP